MSPSEESTAVETAAVDQEGITAHGHDDDDGDNGERVGRNLNLTHRFVTMSLF